MRLCLISSDPLPGGGLGAWVQRLARLLAAEHEVTVVHTYETSARLGAEQPPGLRQLVADPSRLPPVAFSCDDHARSAAAMLAIEQAFGDDPPDYLEVPDHRGHGLVPLQARDAGHRSLRGCAVGVRLHGAVEMICLQEGTWPRPENRIVFDCEREVLRLADAVLWPGGDTLALYERVLGAGLPAPVRMRLPLDRPAAPPSPAPRDPAAPLRILYAGRLRGCRGALVLADACAGLGDAAWRLTFVGADTSTAPLGRSVRSTIETMFAADARVQLRGPVSAAELEEAFAQHDLLVVPAQFEVWSGVALEAMRAGLPVLATPIGGMTEIVEEGVSGWLAAGRGPDAVRRALERLLGDRSELERVRASGEVYRRFERLTAAAPIADGYRDLLGGLRAPAPAARRRPEPLVTGIVPYYGEHEMVGEAVASLLSQTHRNLEVTIVNDGSFEPEDAILAELAEDPRVRVLTQVNQGDQRARNLGVLLADGPYVALLDADNLLEPEFVARAVAMLEQDPELAYVTCWLRFFGERAALDSAGTEGYAPLGNGVRSDESINSDGDTIAVLPRRLFAELGYRYDEGATMSPDWTLYRTLKDDGRLGAVIPERLARYRVRPDSLSHAIADDTHSRNWDETLSRRWARRLQWTPS